MQWIVVAAIVMVTFLTLPMQMRSIRRSRRGRSGSIVASLADGANAALDPKKATIVAEMERRRNADGEEAAGGRADCRGQADASRMMVR